HRAVHHLFLEEWDRSVHRAKAARHASQGWRRRGPRQSTRTRLSPRPRPSQHLARLRGERQRANSRNEPGLRARTHGSEGGSTTPPRGSADPRRFGAVLPGMGPRTQLEPATKPLKLTAAGFRVRRSVLDTARGTITRGRSLAAIR